MVTLVRIVLLLIVLVIVLGAAAYLDGSRLPVEHTATVEDLIDAPPAKVFALITDVAHAPDWRHAVRSVEVLPSDQGRDHWIENLGRGVRMNFIATRTVPLDASGHALRVVRLSDPQFGGDWTYVVSPGPTPDRTDLKITESGYIHPPLYRFMMERIFGMKRNLNQYLSDMKAAVR